jgi:hypothetical protein
LVEPTENDFYVPEFGEGDTLAEETYKGAVLAALGAYKSLREQGLLPSVARLVLPQATMLGLTAGINLRSLRDLAVLRRCHIFQGIWWNPLLDMMRQEVADKIDPALARIFDYQPCDLGPCLSKVEQFQRVNKQDPHDPCPRFFCKRPLGDRCVRKVGCEGCMRRFRERGELTERSLRK